MKFAIEKSVEIGITSFIIFSSKRTVSKSTNLKRLQKIALSAMKQSLRAHLPAIKEMKFEEIINRPVIKILLDQKAGKIFSFTNDHQKVYYFLFGPEGGFENDEIKALKPERTYRLGEHRLRSETAIVQCASLINSA
jgi:16S rRNA (uracil1498-N3)-methyltransferase